MYTTSTHEKRKPMEATESLTEAAKTPTAAVEVLVLPTEHDYRDPATVYKQSNLKIPDMSHHNLTPAMLEDLEYPVVRP